MNTFATPDYPREAAIVYGRGWNDSFCVCDFSWIRIYSANILSTYLLGTHLESRVGASMGGMPCFS